MSTDREQYTMGYGPAATAIMAERTAQSHAAFFLPYLKPGLSLLDCGCGPGTITIGLAEAVAPGQVVGTEIEEAHVVLARENAGKHSVPNLQFKAANLYQLPFDDGSFDAVFISAVLSNLGEPLRGLREAYRVLKPGGVIGIKEFDHGGDFWYPSEPALEKYAELYVRMRRDNGHDPETGRKIGGLLLETGFSDLKFAAVYESFADPERAGAFAYVSAGLLAEGWGETFTSRGWATAAEIDEMRAAWQRFAASPGAIFAAAWCEAVARKAQ
jgi:SAM-dependent methyltransferase